MCVQLCTVPRLLIHVFMCACSYLLLSDMPYMAKYLVNQMSRSDQLFPFCCVSVVLLAL